jgi:hypothetical protein
VTGGADDAVARALRRGRADDPRAVRAAPLGRYDVVVADLLYTHSCSPR